MPSVGCRSAQFCRTLIPSTSGSEYTTASPPVPCPAGCKQKTPRGTSENAFSVIVRNAQNSAPNKNDILIGPNRRCFFLLITFIVILLPSLILGMRVGALLTPSAPFEPTAATVRSFVSVSPLGHVDSFTSG